MHLPFESKAEINGEGDTVVDEAESLITELPACASAADAAHTSANTRCFIVRSGILIVYLLVVDDWDSV